MRIRCITNGSPEDWIVFKGGKKDRGYLKVRRRNGMRLANSHGRIRWDLVTRRRWLTPRPHRREEKTPTKMP
jgi:hypothetical protein